MVNVSLVGCGALLVAIAAVSSAVSRRRRVALIRRAKRMAKRNLPRLWAMRVSTCAAFVRGRKSTKDRKTAKALKRELRKLSISIGRGLKDRRRKIESADTARTPSRKRRKGCKAKDAARSSVCANVWPWAYVAQLWDSSER